MSKYTKLTAEQLDVERDNLIGAQQKAMKARSDAEMKAKKEQSVIQEELDKIEQERRSR